MNSCPQTKDITTIQNFYNLNMGAIDQADQLAIGYSKERHTRSKRWVNAFRLRTKATMSQKGKCKNDHAETPLSHRDFIQSVCVGYMERAKEIEHEIQHVYIIR